MHELSAHQAKLLEMMRFMHVLCTQNSIKYYTLGGTTLGAIRHNGFIPWDDDIDIGLPRTDYVKLCKLMENQITEGYVLETIHSTDSNYCYPYAKLYDTTTTLVENTAQKLRRGVYIDVFPLDGLGNSLKEARFLYAPIRMKKMIHSLRVTKVRKGRSSYKNALLVFAQKLPESGLGAKALASQIDRLIQRRDYNDCQFVGNLVGAWGFREVIPKKVFGKPVMHCFENMMVYVPQDYDAYLTSIYGDWRTLPPTEKRVSHHDYYLNLNHSYLDDLRKGEKIK